MKYFFSLMACIAMIFSTKAIAQTGEYNDLLTAQYIPVLKRNVQFVSRLSHGESMSKLEEMRILNASQVKTAMSLITRIKFIEEDKNNYRGQVLEALYIIQQAFAYDYREVTVLSEKKESSAAAAQRFYDLQMVCERKIVSAYQQIEDARLDFTNRYELPTSGIATWEKTGTALTALAEANLYYRRVYGSYATIKALSIKMSEAIDRENYKLFNDSRLQMQALCPGTLSELMDIEPYSGDDRFLESVKGFVTYYLTASGDPFIRITDLMKRKAKLSAGEAKEYSRIIVEHDKRTSSIVTAVEQANRMFILRQLPVFE